MKVRDLIAMLQQYDPEMVVMVEGYEGGYQPVEELGFASVELEDQGWYCGDYGSTWNRDGQKILFFPRERGNLLGDGWDTSCPPDGDVSK